RELNKKSNQLAAHIIQRGVKPGMIVAIMAERTSEMIIGLLGILKAGAAYLPIDTEYPEERIKYMLKDSNTKNLLTGIGEPQEIKKIDEMGIQRINIQETTHAPHPESGKRDSAAPGLAYVIYTSGSTGKPKGVMIEHASFLNFIKGMTGSIIEFKPGDCILSLTTICFDIFGLETLLPLTTGTKILIGTRNEQQEPSAAGQLMTQECVSIFQTTPSRLQMLLSEEKARAGLAQLDNLLIGGEALPLKLLEEARKITTGQIYNVYGPTETTVWSTAKKVTGDNQLNIGKPITNTRIYILDRWEKLQPIGIAGELCIAGDGLARGYINKPELTAERFVKAGAQLAKAHPNNQYPITGNYLYRTGDLARWHVDGNIEYLGRIDQQVKIRGFRIELEEIENSILTHPEIKETVVLAKHDNTDNKYLCAYYVAENTGTPGSENQTLTTGLRTYLTQYLPDYMIPSYIIPMETLPLTNNGKIDRKTLSQQPIINIKHQTYTAPRNNIEEKLSEIWAHVLTTQKHEIGIDDNFFEIGGHSLRATIMVAKIHKEFNVKLPLTEIFKKNTIRTQGQTIKEYAPEKYEAIEPVEKKEYYNMSAAQKR
ncbi:MAG: non-ribosomal peptide synthetase, partial [bacterium]|nr:non-ribosomal peptide synthetase [bacterium]